ETASIFFALTKLITVIGVPSTGFTNNVVFDAHIQKTAFARNTFAIQNIEFSLFERWRHLIFNDLGTSTVTNWVTCFFKGLNTPNIDTYRSIELQDFTTSSCFRLTKEDTNLFTQLVDKYRSCFGLGQAASDFT